MYEKFYHFKEKPFQIAPNPGYLYKSPRHQNALTFLEYGLSENVGFILLTGEIGSGKTTLIQYILNKIAEDTEAAVIFNTNVSAYQLLLMILNEFELPSQKFGKTTALDILNQYLIQKYAENKRVLLIIDEAQNLSPAALEEVRMLSNLQTEDQVLLQIMLVGQPELISKLGKPKMRQLSQRIAVNFHLEGLNREEVGNYVSFRLDKAGGQRDLFTAEALDMIHELSGGIPRSINLLCQAALVYGFADGAETIDKNIIEQITEDKIGLGPEIKGGEDPIEKTVPTTARLSRAVKKRLGKLENEVRHLQLQLETQIREVEQRAETFKDDLVGSLKSQLGEERDRNAKLLRQFSQLEMKYEALMRVRAGFEKGPDSPLADINTEDQLNKNS
jgi:general secretion pathway protein A